MVTQNAPAQVTRTLHCWLKGKTLLQGAKGAYYELKVLGYRRDGRLLEFPETYRCWDTTVADRWVGETEHNLILVQARAKEKPSSAEPSDPKNFLWSGLVETELPLPAHPTAAAVPAASDNGTNRGASITPEARSGGPYPDRVYHTAPETNRIAALTAALRWMEIVGVPETVRTKGVPDAYALLLFTAETFLAYIEGGAVPKPETEPITEPAPSPAEPPASQTKVSRCAKHGKPLAMTPAKKLGHHIDGGGWCYGAEGTG